MDGSGAEVVFIWYEFPPLRGGIASYALGVARHFSVLPVRVLARKVGEPEPGDGRLNGLNVERAWVKVGPIPLLGDVNKALLFGRVEQGPHDLIRLIVL